VLHQSVGRKVNRKQHPARKNINTLYAAPEAQPIFLASEFHLDVIKRRCILVRERAFTENTNLALRLRAAPISLES